MRALPLTAVVLAVGLGGCVYDPYYGYAYYPPDPLVAGAIVGGVATAAVLTDTGSWPYYGGYYHGYYGGYPRYRYSYGGPWHGGHYSHRPYHHGGYRRQ